MLHKTRKALRGPTIVFSTTAALVAALMLVPVSASAALPPVTANNAGTVYDNIPHPTPGNVFSEAFEAQSVSEFGTAISMTHGSLTNPVVTVLMSSWGCESGSWTNDTCVTTPGATFAHDITLNIYAAGSSTPGSAPGALLKTQTKTFNIPYRPSKDDTHCTGADVGKWYDAASNTCFNGYATPIRFTFTGTLFPAHVIVSVAYNTSHYGAAPIGTAPCSTSPGGCGYDSLNVALNPAPSIGAFTQPGWYLNTSWSGATCAPPTTNAFTLGSACPYGQAAIAVQGAIGTVLKAYPSIAQILPGLRITLHLSARLPTSAGNPVVGEPIVFTAAGRGVCVGITNINGVAACGGLLFGVVKTVLALGYRATFAGDGVLKPSTAHGSLIIIG
jgi:hypothetical protein